MCCDQSLIVEFLIVARGGPKICPMAISDLVLLHNKATEGLAKNDRVGYDIYLGIADTKALFLKFCKQFERRIRSMVPTYRVVPSGDGEGSTSVSIPGFLVDAKGKAKKSFAPQKVELQFLESHKKLYMELHQDFSKIEYAPQSEASLQNFQTLLMMEISLLMGCDVDWGTASTGSAADAGAEVLPPAAGNDDGDGSSDSGADATVVRRGAAAAPSITAAAAAAAAAGGGDAGGEGAAAGTIAPAAAGIDPADAAAAAAYAAAADAEIEVVPDLDDFTTWQPGTWGALDLDKIPIPTDPMRSICSVRSYLAVAMLLWYDPALRAKHTRAWDSLTAAWKATFHTELTAGALEKWPEDGPHGFSKAQSTWLSATLRFLKGQGRPPSRRRASAHPRATSPAPPPAAKPASRSSVKANRGGVASKTTSNPDPVQSSRRFATVLNCILSQLYHLFHLLVIMTICIYYINYGNYIHYLHYINYVVYIKCTYLSYTNSCLRHLTLLPCQEKTRCTSCRSSRNRYGK